MPVNFEKYNFFQQCFLPWIEHLPHDEMKLLIGDNLASHMSPTVLQICKENNIRFCFLPENSTHLLQPLDVGVFGPMKRRWREILRQWRLGDGKSYASLPKPEFPKLLRVLMRKDYRSAIKGGFDGTGLYPFNPQRVLSKLPNEEPEDTSGVHRAVIK